MRTRRVRILLLARRSVPCSQALAIGAHGPPRRELGNGRHLGEQVGPAHALEKPQIVQRRAVALRLDQLLPETLAEADWNVRHALGATSHDAVDLSGANEIGARGDGLVGRDARLGHRAGRCGRWDSGSKRRLTRDVAGRGVGDHRPHDDALDVRRLDLGAAQQAFQRQARQVVGDEILEVGAGTQERGPAAADEHRAAAVALRRHDDAPWGMGCEPSRPQ